MNRWSDNWDAVSPLNEMNERHTGLGTGLRRAFGDDSGQTQLKFAAILDRTPKKCFAETAEGANDSKIYASVTPSDPAL